MAQRTKLKETVSVVRSAALALRSTKDLTQLYRCIGNPTVTMIGEATHGTDEFYRYRCEITKQLILQKKVDFVAVEADWPDAYRVNRYVLGVNTKDTSSEEALQDFTSRFPMWMWRNEVIKEFVDWLKDYNSQVDTASKIGFYGLDLYSLFRSADEVIKYLKRVSPNDAKTAKERYSTLNMFRQNAHDYATALMLKLAKTQEDEVIAVLVDIKKKESDYIKKDGGGFIDEEDEYFYTKENAELVKAAEEYYRKTFAGGVETWNLRDKHMANTLERLCEYWKTRKEKLRAKKRTRTDESEEDDNTNKKKNLGRAVVWAHNSHLGDCRATELEVTGELNLGQLIREKFHINNTYNIGFSTNQGTVRAARKWGGTAQEMQLNTGLKGSYEELFHNISEIIKKEEDTEDFYMILRNNVDSFDVNKDAVRELNESRLQRAVGVQYVKDREKQAHYLLTKLPLQFDAVIHLETTHALVPLD